MLCFNFERHSAFNSKIWVADGGAFFAIFPTAIVHNDFVKPDSLRR